MNEKYKIAIVDDEQDVREIFVKILSDEFNVDFFEYSDAAYIIKEMHENKFDLILTDYSMPIVDGNAFIKILRLTTNPNSETPVMFITGKEPYLISDEKISKNIYYIQKPFEARRILNYAKLCLLKN